MSGPARLARLFRYPVKGLGAEPLARAALVPGEAIAGDRTFALAHAGSAFDPAAPAWVARRNFVQTAQSPELARAATTLADGVLTLEAPAAGRLAARPDTPEGRAAIEAWADRVAGHRQPGPYRLVRLPAGGLHDVAEAHLSIASEGSLRALSERAGRALEHRRFRANLWLEGLAPWEEFDLVGRELRIGPARLRVTARIGRCNAVTASPATGTRDTAVLELLEAGWGHTDFGVYAQVIGGGEVAPGDPVTLPGTP